MRWMAYVRGARDTQKIKTMNFTTDTYTHTEARQIDTQTEPT